jgi:hypothetical protein
MRSQLEVSYHRPVPRDLFCDALHCLPSGLRQQPATPARNRQ